MKTVRIYQPGDYRTGQLLELSSAASQHVGVVLRMQVGECLTLFCGDDREFSACIETVKKNQVMVSIGQVISKSRESPLAIHLAQAISKGERMELVMQKATELGVASIIPVITERCIVKLDKDRMAKKLHQWQALVVAACEQSGRNTVPMVYPPVNLEHYMHDVQDEMRFVLHPNFNKRCSDYTMDSSSIALLIGPEGGFSQDELLAADNHGFHPLSLGPRVLRTETAAITALSVLQALAGDL